MPEFDELFTTLRETLRRVIKEHTEEAQHRRTIEDPHLRAIIDRLRRQGVSAGLDRENDGIMISESETHSQDDMALIYAAVPEVTCVYLMTNNFSDVGIRRIADMSHLRHLRISYCQVTGNGLRWLVGMRGLHSLDCSGLKSPDDGTAHINQLASLRVLAVGGCPLTDRGVSRLTALHALEQLNLSSTQVASGLAGLKNSPRLHTLTLERTRLNDEGCAAIADCIALRQLFVSQTPVTDQGLSHLSSLPNLSWLGMHGTRVTDAGLELLIHCATLRQLGVDQRQLTPRGIDALQRLPNLEEMSVDGEQYDPATAQRLEAACPALKVRWYAPGAAAARDARHECD